MRIESVSTKRLRSAVALRVRRAAHGVRLAAASAGRPSELRRRMRYSIVRKEDQELAYWKRRKRSEGKLERSHYEAFYTRYFDLRRADYAGKAILDVGCGPRGSLEWATEAAARVGVDPLADEYRRLGADSHEMTYVAAPVERMPLPDEGFDVVCSFNSLDHVDDLEEAAAEIKRVLRPGGLFLLIVDVNHTPTDSEPHQLDWRIVERFAPEIEPIAERRLERAENIYMSVERGVPYDPSAGEHSGVLAAKLRKSAHQAPG